MRKSVLILALCALMLATPQLVAAQSDTFAVVAPWVVVVYQPQPDGRYVSLGTGSVVQGGYVITAAHVIESDHAPVFLGAHTIHYPLGITFVIGSDTQRVTGIAVDRVTAVAPLTLTGTYMGRYIATPQLGAVYEGVFQISQDGSTIAGSITTNSGRSGDILGTIAGTRITATMTFTDACGGRASASIDVTNSGRTLVGNYTATDCLGTYSGAFDFTKQ